MNELEIRRMELVDKIVGMYGESNRGYSQEDISVKLNINVNDVARTLQMHGYHNTIKTQNYPIKFVDEFNFLDKYLKNDIKNQL